MPYPIVLAHGVARFDALLNFKLNLDNTEEESLDQLHYFKGVRSMLQSHGFRVYHSDVPFASDVEKRGEGLRLDVLEILNDARKHAAETGGELPDKVNIIAHSMGGLDSRHMMFNDRNSGRIHEHVASISTISTPHCGSPYADRILQRFPNLPRDFSMLGLNADALKDLTTTACKEFNARPEVLEFEERCRTQHNIALRTFAGKQKLLAVFTLLKQAYRVIEDIEGDNDGLVSVESAKWNRRPHEDVLDDTDHLNELGWWDLAQVWDMEGPGQLMKRIHGFYLGLARKLP